MKSLVFDSSSLISLSMNNLLWILEPLKAKYGGEFNIPASVKNETVDNPLRTKRFKFEALQIVELLTKNILTLYLNAEVKTLSAKLLEIANNIFYIKGHSLRIVHDGEMESLATVLLQKSDALVIDERTTRVLIEEPEALAALFERKFHTPIKVDNNKLKEFQKLIGYVYVIRSVEIATVAYNAGLLQRFANSETKKTVKTNVKKDLLEGILWGLKFKGCAVTDQEIEEIMKLEKV